MTCFLLLETKGLLTTHLFEGEEEQTALFRKLKAISPPKEMGGQPDIPDYDNEEFCVACGGGPAAPEDFYTCDGCGNAVCRACAREDEDDFGTTRCSPACGAS